MTLPKSRSPRVTNGKGRRRPGRPRLVTEEVTARVVELKRLGWSWKAIGRETGVASETCRRAVYDFRKTKQTRGTPTPGKGPQP